MQVRGGHDVRRVAVRERNLARLHARIRACTKCVDAGYIGRATTIVAGSASDRIAIVGQAPGAVEVVMGKPFAGRSGAELRRWLAEAGIDEAHLPYRTAITKCFPGKTASGASRWLNDGEHRNLLHRGLQLLKRALKRLGP